MNKKMYDHLAVAEAVREACVTECDKLAKVFDRHRFHTWQTKECVDALRALDLAAIIAALPAARPEPVNVKLVDALAAVHAKFCSRPYGTGSYITKNIRDQVAQALEAAKATPEPAVPDGWQLVPVEANEEMVDAGCLALVGSIGGYEAGQVNKCWDAMLAATQKGGA